MKCTGPEKMFGGTFKGLVERNLMKVMSLIKCTFYHCIIAVPADGNRHWELHALLLSFLSCEFATFRTKTASVQPAELTADAV